LTHKFIFFKQYFREGELHVLYTMFVKPFLASNDISIILHHTLWNACLEIDGNTVGSWCSSFHRLHCVAYPYPWYLLEMTMKIFMNWELLLPIWAN